MLAAADGLAVQERIARVQALCEVKVILHAPTAGGAKAIGISMERNDTDCFIVSAVSGLGEMSAKIEEGYVVSDIGGAPPTDKNELTKELLAGTSLTVTFRRPEPDIPFHGSARKGIHKQTRFKMLPEQEAWLNEYVFKDGRDHMRPSVAWNAMKSKFSGKIRVDTSTPAWLDKDQIAKWLASQVKKEKELRKEERRTAEKAAKEPKPADEERPAKKSTKNKTQRYPRAPRGQHQARPRKQEAQTRFREHTKAVLARTQTSARKKGRPHHHNHPRQRRDPKNECFGDHFTYISPPLPPLTCPPMHKTRGLLLWGSPLRDMGYKLGRGGGVSIQIDFYSKAR